MQFVIKRSIWLRGEGPESALFRRRDEKRCCLGLYLESLGWDKEELAECGRPDEVERKETMPRWLLDSTTVNDLMRANDRITIPSEKLREMTIQTLFKTEGVYVTFED